MTYLSIDVGSTFTKGLLAEPDRRRLAIRDRLEQPTDRDNPGRGVEQLVRRLTGRTLDRAAEDMRIALSSSARGGLHIDAVGVVPDLTAEAARQTALSAGARVSRTFANGLTDEDVAELEADAPDIVLLTGGTDGGNERQVRHNAQRLSRSALTSQILYAGNRAMASEVAKTLKDKAVTTTANILPALDTPNPESARRAIQRIFLRHIAEGKGIAAVAGRLGCEPRPTPLAMHEFVETLHEHEPDWTSFCLVDVGGATTDYYSCDPGDPVGACHKGLPEPLIKRSVEGDLGVRLNADTVLAVIPPQLRPVPDDVFGRYTDLLRDDPGRLPATGDEQLMDASLAAACVAAATERHAGRLETVYTADGAKKLQTGKDLRQVPRLIATGGVLAHSAGTATGIHAKGARFDARQREILSPRAPRWFVDRDYVLPLLANIAPLQPARAAATAVAQLTALNAKTGE